MGEEKYIVYKYLGEVISLLHKMKIEKIALSARDKELLCNFIIGIRKYYSKIASQQTDTYTWLTKEEFECLSELASEDEKEYAIENCRSFPYYEHTENERVTDADYIYRDNAECVAQRCLNVIIRKLKDKGFSNRQITEIFKTDEARIKEICAFLRFDDFQYQKPRKLEDLKKSLIRAYSGEYPEPSWLHEMEDEHTLAKTLSNAIIRMYEYGVKMQMIMELTNSSVNEVEEALDRGVQDIFLRADEWR